jgi:hypothetical protein
MPVTIKNMFYQQVLVKSMQICQWQLNTMFTLPVALEIHVLPASGSHTPCSICPWQSSPCSTCQRQSKTMLYLSMAVKSMFYLSVAVKDHALSVNGSQVHVIPVSGSQRPCSTCSWQSSLCSICAMHYEPMAVDVHGLRLVAALRCGI